MKSIGICGSSRSKNTEYMIKMVLDATGLDFEIIKLKDKRIESCKACKGCYESHECVHNDDIQEILKKLMEVMLLF